jgi:hypothetical protein
MGQTIQRRGRNGDKILKQILQKYDVTVWTGLDSCGLGYSPVARSSEHGNEPVSPIKRVGFLDHLSDYQLLKRTPLRI